MPYLAVERARRDEVQADEAQRPLVLTRPAGSSLVVAQICPHARELGLRPGFALGQAHAMAPGLVALPHEPRRDQDELERLAQRMLRFSPVVEPVPPDTLLLDVTGCERLFGGEETLARRALAELAARGFRARAAIADTVGATWALATTVGGATKRPATARREPRPPLRQQRCTPRTHFEICIVPAGQTSAYLAALPPAGLRIAPQVNAQLDALGVRCIGDLLMLPRASLTARFGPQLVQRLQQALGEIFEGLTPYFPPAVPAVHWTFEYPVRDATAILTVARRLLENLLQQLRCSGRALQRLECVLRYENTTPEVVAVDLARATRAPEHVLLLLAKQLEKRGHSTFSERVEAPPCVGVLLIARHTTRWHTTQEGLFETRAPRDDEAFGTLIDRLAGRLGHEALLRPHLVDDHQPERACRYVPFIEATHPGTAAGIAEEAGASETGCSAGLPPRPVRLFPRPVPIRVISLVPDGPPTWFAYRGHAYVVTEARGPERIETAWWRGPDVRRDYFRVTTLSGAEFWIFRTPQECCWYLHGVFA